MDQAQAKEKTNARSNFGGRGWLLVILCLVGCFVSSSGSGSINVGFATFSAAMGATQTQLMLGTTIGQIAGAVIAFFFGQLLISKVSPRVTILWCSIIYAVFFFLNSYSTSLAWYYVTFTVFMAASFIWAFLCIQALVANWFPRKRGVAMGWITIGLPLGSGVAANLMSAINNHIGFHVAYLPYAIIAVVVGILYVVCLKDTPAECGCYPDNDKNLDVEQLKAQEKAMQEYQAKSPWNPKRIFSTPAFWFITIGIAFMMFASGFMAQVIPTLLTFGVSMTAAPRYMLLVCAFACVGSYLLGWVDTKLGSKPAIVITFCMIFAMALFEQLNALAPKLVGFMFLGLVMGAGSNFMISIIMRLWGQQSCMRVFRYAQPICTIVSSFGSTVIAAIATAFGGNYNMSFLFIGALGVVGLILILFVKDGAAKKKEEKFMAKEAEEAKN